MIAHPAAVDLLYQPSSQACPAQAAGQFYWNGMALCAPGAAKVRPHAAATPPPGPAAAAAHAAAPLDGFQPDWMLAAALLLVLGLRTHFYFFPRRAGDGPSQQNASCGSDRTAIPASTGEPL